MMLLQNSASEVSSQEAAIVQVRTEATASSSQKASLDIVRTFTTDSDSSAEVRGQFSITLTAPSYKDITYVFGPSMFTPKFVLSPGVQNDYTAILQPRFDTFLANAIQNKTIEYTINNIDYKNDTLSKVTLKRGTSKTFAVSIRTKIPVPTVRSSDNYSIPTIAFQDFGLQMKLVSVNYFDAGKSKTLPITNTNLSTPFYNFLAAGNFEKILVTQAGKPNVTSAVAGLYPTPMGLKEGVEIVGTVPVLIYNDREVPFVYEASRLHPMYIKDQKRFSYFPAPETLFTSNHAIVGAPTITVAPHSYKIVTESFKNHYFSSDNDLFDPLVLKKGDSFGMCMNASTDDLKNENGSLLDCYASNLIRALFQPIGSYATVRVQ